jgi:predicted HAD superfamily Cof-like phosphohydrolase
MKPEYWSKVSQFNEMYRLPRSLVPEAPSDESLLNFKKILLEEVDEVDEILAVTDPLERMVALCDWLGDLIVYASTKGDMHGLPMQAILIAIMDSNFSKLGADGKPIYNPDTGKVLKGPNFWGPEIRIREILLERLIDART